MVRDCLGYWVLRKGLRIVFREVGERVVQVEPSEVGAESFRLALVLNAMLGIKKYLPLTSSSSGLSYKELSHNAHTLLLKSHHNHASYGPEAFSTVISSLFGIGPVPIMKRLHDCGPRDQ